RCLFMGKDSMVLIYGEQHGACFALTDKHHKNKLLQSTHPAMGDLWPDQRPKRPELRSLRPAPPFRSAATLTGCHAAPGMCCWRMHITNYPIKNAIASGSRTLWRRWNLTARMTGISRNLSRA